MPKEIYPPKPKDRSLRQPKQSRRFYPPKEDMRPRKFRPGWISRPPAVIQS
jgi:hypothetical protein